MVAVNHDTWELVGRKTRVSSWNGTTEDFGTTGAHLSSVTAARLPGVERIMFDYLFGSRRCGGDFRGGTLW